MKIRNTFLHRRITFLIRNVLRIIHTIIVVSHGVTIRAIVMRWLHLPFEWFEKEPNPKNCSVRVINCGKYLGYL